MSDDVDDRPRAVLPGDGGFDPASMATVDGHVTTRSVPRPWRRRDWLPAAVAVVVIAVLATGRFSSSSGSPDPSAAPTSTAPAMDPSSTTATPFPATPSPTAVTESDPSWTLDLIGQLECDGPPASIGGEVGEVYPEAQSRKSPEAAMDEFVANALYASLPVRGYERTNREDHWARFTYRVSGSTKAIVVVGDVGPEIDPGVWSVVGLKACDPAEFAPDSGFTGGLLTVWLDAEGNRVPTTIIHEIKGPGHCDWESTIWLSVDGEVFLRDPNDVLTGATIDSFDPDVVLPPEAESTGYHEGGRTIWRDDDPDAIYVVLSDRVERWPRTIDALGCM